jgi:hypothetical protein
VALEEEYSPAVPWQGRGWGIKLWYLPHLSKTEKTEMVLSGIGGGNKEHPDDSLYFSTLLSP